MTEEQKKALLDKVKKKCYITDDSMETNARLEDIIDDAVLNLSHQLGVSDDFDFSVPSQERALFLNYCFYAWNDGADEFKANYLADILAVRHKNEVTQNEETETEQL